MNKVLKKTTLISILTCVGIVGFSAYGIDNLFADKVSKEYIDWLSKIDDEKNINELFIPGTHNSGAKYSFIDFSGKCQDISIMSQLTLGTRFLDIRLKNDSSGLKVVHNFIDQKLSFKSVLNTCYSFLDDNPSEFIFMSIKDEISGNSKLMFEERLKREINAKYFYSENDFPKKVKDVRGKIIQLSRYSSPTIGFNCYDGWKNEGKENTNSFVLDFNQIYVQDYYKVDKLESKQYQIMECSVIDGYNLKLNFTSGYYEDGFPQSSSFELAKDINPWIFDTLLKNDNLKGQVFVSDFITDSLAGFIIDKNFPEENN